MKSKKNQKNNENIFFTPTAIYGVATKMVASSIFLNWAASLFASPSKKTRQWLAGGLIFLIFVFLIGAVVYWRISTSIPTVNIGVVVPDDGVLSPEDEGFLYGALVKADELNKGCNLFTQLQKTCGIQGHRVEIIQIAKEEDAQRVVAVLGDFEYQGNSSDALLNTSTYEQKKIPALITALTGETGRNGVFRLVPDSKQTGIFLANYARKVLNSKTVAIIYDGSNPNSVLLKDGFQYPYSSIAIDSPNGTVTLGTIAPLNSTGKNPKDLPLDSSKISTADIVGQLVKNSGKYDLIFLATGRAKAQELIIGMRAKGINKTPILSGNELAGDGFSRTLNHLPEETIQKGYFTNGIYASSPIIFDGASQKAQDFRQRYRQYITNINATQTGNKTLDTEPSWAAAISYDGVDIVAKAINSYKDDQGQNKFSGETSQLPGDRELLLNALNRLENIKTSVDGVMGKTYFEQHSAVKPIIVGLFSEQQFVSAPVQFYPVPDSRSVPNFQQELNNGHIVTLDGRYMYRTDVVYAGINLNEISSIDEGSSSYYADFFVWFRYQPNSDDDPIDASTIQFTNAVDQPTVDTLDNRQLGGGMKYKLMRVKGTFTNTFNFLSYPFDQQGLVIRFRHTELERQNLMFVFDMVGASNQVNDASLIIRSAGDWNNAGDPEYFQSSNIVQSSLGNPELFDFQPEIEYSTFNAQVDIKRNLFSFMLRNLLPVLFSIALAYLSFYLPRTEFSTREGVLSGTILSIAFFHLSVSSFLSGIGYTTALDYIFYFFYFIILFGLFTTLMEWFKQVQNSDIKEEVEKLNSSQEAKADPKIGAEIEKKKALIAANEQIGINLRNFGRISYPIMMTLLVFGYWYHFRDYFKTIDRGATNADQVVQATTTAVTHTNATPKTVLQLASWRADDEEVINMILKKFEDSHPGIDVQFVPTVGSEYDKIMRINLENGNGADLYYLSPPGGRTIDPESFFTSNYLADLTALVPEMGQAFDQNDLKTWQTGDGHIYGVPIYAVSHGIYYNKDIFERLNIRVEDIQTWDQLMDVASQIKKAGYTPFANGLYPDDRQRIYDYVFLNMAPNYIGGREGRERFDRGERCFNSFRVEKLFTDIQKLAPYLPVDYDTINYDQSLNSLWYEGKAAMWFGGSFDIRKFKDNLDKNNVHWGVFAVPPPEQGTTKYLTFHIDTAIAMNAKLDPRKRDAAIQFLKWLTTDDFGKLIGQYMPGFYPLQKSLKGVNYIDTNTLDPKYAQYASYSQAFLDLNAGHELDVRWQLPINGVPDGRTLVQDSIYGLLSKDKNKRLTPQQAADNLQYGLAEWYTPIQQLVCNPVTTITPTPSVTPLPSITPTFGPTTTPRPTSTPTILLTLTPTP